MLDQMTTDSQQNMNDVACHKRCSIPKRSPKPHRNREESSLDRKMPWLELAKY